MNGNMNGLSNGKTQHPKITHATREDIPTILAMISELADHEKALSSVQATEESLANTLCFAPTSGEVPSGPGYAKVLLLRLDNHPVGMALYFNNYSTWRSAPGVYLEDLYVRETYRGKGYGKLLIQALAKETKRIGGARLEWCCLRCNEKSLGFYRSLGAREMKEWVTLRCDGEVLEKLASSGEVNGKTIGEVVTGAE